MNFNGILLFLLDWSKKKDVCIELNWMMLPPKVWEDQWFLEQLLLDGTETLEKFASPSCQDEPCSMEDYADDAAALLETVMPERQNPKRNVALSWELDICNWLMKHGLKKNPTKHVLLLGGFAVI